MKLYTRTGDDGSTSLFGGKRVSKDALRVEAFGTVDELNCAIGLAHCMCRVTSMAEVLRHVQERLFEIGADLATPEGSSADSKITRIGDDHVSTIEGQIDIVCEPLPQMRFFVLPGGNKLAARLHMARAVGRRAERLTVALSRAESINPNVVIYLNRLSDLLFAMARRANQLEGVADVPWKGQ